MRFCTLIAAAATLVGMSAAIETIEMKNRHFYGSETGKPFFIRGVDYMPGGASSFEKGHDPLSDINTCARDIYLFQKLGINTIRVYSVDPAIDHNECMTLLAQAGIYLVLDVNTPLQGEHLNNQEPWTTYNPDYMKHIFSVVEVFSGYANTLAFLAGNEVVFEKISADTSPNYIKATVRDIKAYITEQVSRVIPVGYSNADDLNYRMSLAKYLECGDVGYIDFFGVNSYQWCGHNTFEGSGYDQLVEDYADYSLPVFFTEFGCNEAPPRKWEEVASLYSKNMTSVFSGGLVYEYSQEANDYGIVDIAKNGQAKTRNDYTALLAAYNKLDKDIPVPKDTVFPKRPAECPPENSDEFAHITANLTLPTTFGAEYIKNGMGDLAVRGHFTDKLSTRATKFNIIIDGKTITDKAVVSEFPSDPAPLKAGGHGKNTGGGVGDGAPVSDSPDDGTNGESAANTVGPRGMVFVGSLCAVALGFGLFL